MSPSARLNCNGSLAVYTVVIATLFRKANDTNDIHLLPVAWLPPPTHNLQVNNSLVLHQQSQHTHTHTHIHTYRGGLNTPKLAL